MLEVINVASFAIKLLMVGIGYRFMLRVRIITTYALTIMAFLHIISCSGSKRHLRPIEKNGLLELVKKLVKIESKEGPLSEASRKLLQTYAAQYELIIVDSTFKAADFTKVQVRIVHDEMFPRIDLRLPLRLQKMLAYADLEHAFGKGIEAPRPKEPLGFSVMYHPLASGQITIAAHSDEPPETIHPNIYEILIYN